MIFYTYAYLREDGTPYYIGKGKGMRAYYKSKGQVKPPRDKSKIIFLKQNLSEEEAFNHEIYMIAVFGRKDLGTGILHNRTDGGEGQSGAIVGKKTRLKLSSIRKGKPKSEEHKRKISGSKQNISEETRRKQSEAAKGRKVSDETRKKLSQINKGKVVSEEARRKQSEAQKGRNHSLESRKKMSEAKKGKPGNHSPKGKRSQETKTHLSELKSQRWECIETGYVSNNTGLTKYQRRLGIDPSKRIKIV